MKYDHSVKIDGKYYQAGEEVPEKSGTSKEIVEENTIIDDPVAKRGRPKKS